MERESRKQEGYRLRYFNFLYRMVCNPSPNDAEYYYLLKHLHRSPFYSIVNYDENRIEDGKRLREIFHDSEERSTSPVFYMQEAEACSIFELLVSVAIRMEEVLIGEPFEKTSSECFWILIENLGLVDRDDNVYFTKSQRTIDDVLLRLVERLYLPNGDGGLFPLTNPKKDQRIVEIWYQMHDYLLENFMV